MKNIVGLIAAVFLGAITILSVMASTGRSSREAELTESLPPAVEEAVSQLMDTKSYDIADRKQFIMDLAECLSDLIDSDGEIRIEVQNADLEKGLLSVRVTEIYKHPNGKTGTISCERSVIFDASAQDM